MQLIQLLLPLCDNQSRRFPAAMFSQVTAELTEVFGGVTAFTRSPADGKWRRQQKVQAEEIVIFEVMIPRLSGKWWARYGKELKKRFKQHSIIIRAHKIRCL